jgi:cytochrome b subunit of formate dehydrogenase
MSSELGIWIVSGAVLWIVIGFSGLFLFWKGRHNLGVYFTEMEQTPWEQRAALGWKLENPATPVLGVASQYSHGRLFWRLALWGPPPQLEHTPRAIEALRKYRRACLISAMLQGLLVAALGIMMAPDLFFFALAAFFLSIILVRPQRWTEDPL